MKTDKLQEFKKELKELMAKYNASITYTQCEVSYFGEDYFTIWIDDKSEEINEGSLDTNCL